jgi:D-3-phosphoglycerate dehydrogenase
MRILLADKLAPLAQAQLEAAGHAVVSDPSLSGDALVAAVAEVVPDALVVRSTKVTEAVLAARPELSLVIRAGAGVNTIDLDAAGANGVFVANCPGKNAAAVAELTMGLLVAVDRRIPDNVAAARAGRWDKKGFSVADGLEGRRIALLGFGKIGQGVARRAQAFGMEVVAWSRSLTPEVAAEHGVAFAATPLEAATDADVLSVHLALKDGTRGLVDSTLLGAMREGGILLNTARGPIVDQAALLEALETRGLRCGLDVFDGEPAGKTGELDSPLASHPRVYLTHHIGASTQQAQDAVASEVVRIIRSYVTAGSPDNCVNMQAASSASHVLVVRHLDRVGVLASVLDCLSRANLNVQEMENRIFRGQQAAVARILLHGDPTTVVAELNAHEDVLHTSVRLTQGD